MAIQSPAFGLPYNGNLKAGDLILNSDKKLEKLFKLFIAASAA